MIRCFLTTVDNPYSPYEQFEDWYRFDIDKGYNSSGLLMRMAYTSDQLTDAENAYEIEQAIDQIVANDHSISTKSSKSKSKMMLPESKQRKRGIGGCLKNTPPPQIAPILDFALAEKLIFEFGGYSR